MRRFSTLKITLYAALLVGLGACHAASDNSSRKPYDNSLQLYNGDGFSFPIPPGSKVSVDKRPFRDSTALLNLVIDSIPGCFEDCGSLTIKPDPYRGGVERMVSEIAQRNPPPSDTSFEAITETTSIDTIIVGSVRLIRLAEFCGDCATATFVYEAPGCIAALNFIGDGRSPYVTKARFLKMAGAFKITKCPVVPNKTGMQLLRTAVPNISWNMQSMLAADFDCDAVTDTAYLGKSKDGAFVGIIASANSQPQILPFGIGAEEQANIGYAPVKLSVEDLDYDPSEAVGPVEGFRTSKTCKGLVLSDGETDAFHIFWNHKETIFNWWRA